MRGPHDVITSVADRARAGVFWPRDGHRANENSGQLNQSAVSNEVRDRGVSSHQTRSIMPSALSETDSFYLEKARPAYLPTVE